jgi:hypothetical protein
MQSFELPDRRPPVQTDALRRGRGS